MTFDRCKKCGKRIKENTDGDERYCQGHSLFFDDGENHSSYEGY